MELQPDKVLQDRFDQGQAVGELATTLFRGGVLIDLPHDAVEERLDQTREANRDLPRGTGVGWISAWWRPPALPDRE